MTNIQKSEEDELTTEHQEFKKMAEQMLPIITKLNAQPREENLAKLEDFKSMSDVEFKKIPLIDRFTYFLWENNDKINQNRKIFFEKVKNLYKTKQVGDNISNKDLCEELKQIAIEKINNNYEGSRVVVLNIPKGPATLGHIIRIFQKARHHPLRPSSSYNTFLTISKSIAEKIAYVDCDSDEKLFTGFVFTIINYYKDRITVDNVNEVFDIKPDDIVIQMAPIDNYHDEYRCMGIGSMPCVDGGEYETIMITSWLYADD